MKLKSTIDMSSRPFGSLYSFAKRVLIGIPRSRDSINFRAQFSCKMELRAMSVRRTLIFRLASAFVVYQTAIAKPLWLSRSVSQKRFAAERKSAWLYFGGGQGR